MDGWMDDIHAVAFWAVTDSLGVRDITVTESFLRFFVETCGHYTEYVCTQQDGLNVFEVTHCFVII